MLQVKFTKSKYLFTQSIENATQPFVLFLNIVVICNQLLIWKIN